MTDQPSIDDPLYRLFLAICPGGQAAEFEAWVDAMARLHHVMFPGEPITDEALVDWLAGSRLVGPGYAAAS